MGYSVNKGQSILANIYKTWRELELLEASVLLNRVTKSSIVRLINVEVGDMPKENVAKTLMGIKQMIEQKAAINKGNSMTEYTNPGPIENNVYVPTHGGIGNITATQIGGDVDVKGLADLDWYLNKLYGGLRVPKQYFSETDDSVGFNGGTSLTIISARYAKTVQRLQTTIIQMITDMINLILLDKGLDSYINNFEIHMQSPVTQEDIDRRDNQSAQVQLTSDILNMLQDIQDPIARLKILKNLLANIVTDPDVIAVIQDEIEKLETEQELNTISEEATDEDSNEDIINEINNGEESSPEINNNTEFNLNDLEEPEEEINISSEQNEEETVLPNPTDLGVNMLNPEQ